MNMNEQINIRLSSEDKAVLQKIMDHKQITMSELIRKLIRMYYNQLFKSV